MGKYLQLDYKSSNMYEYSKTSQDGFESHTSNSGNVSYRQYYKAGVYGTLMNVSIRESQRGGQYIGVAMKSLEGDFIYLQFDLFNQRGNIDDRYAESLIRVLGNMKKGENYRLFPYKLDAATQRASDKKENRDLKNKYYDSYGVSVKTANIEDSKVIDKVEPTLVYVGEGNNVIPKLEWIPDELSGKNKPSAVSVESRDNFLKKALKVAVDGHLKDDRDDNNNSNTFTDTQKSISEKPKQENPPVNDVDDLPF